MQVVVESWAIGVSFDNSFILMLAQEENGSASKSGWSCTYSKSKEDFRLIMVCHGACTRAMIYVWLILHFVAFRDMTEKITHISLLERGVGLTLLRDIFGRYLAWSGAWYLALAWEGVKQHYSRNAKREACCARKLCCHRRSCFVELGRWKIQSSQLSTDQKKNTHHFHPMGLQNSQRRGILCKLFFAVHDQIVTNNSSCETSVI